MGTVCEHILRVQFVSTVWEYILRRSAGCKYSFLVQFESIVWKYSSRRIETTACEESVWEYNLRVHYKQECSTFKSTVHWLVYYDEE